LRSNGQEAWSPKAIQQADQVSDAKADPPISIEEALAATGALCPRHGGLIGQRGDEEGMVFLCTACGKYWRYAKNNSPRRGKLKYGRNCYF
jgi:hypothetical protein